MARAGIFHEDSRVELLEGWLIAKRSKHRPGVVPAPLAFHAISALLPPDWFASKKDSVLASDSEPEPDVAVVRGTFFDYGERTPAPLQVSLAVEVANANLSLDSDFQSTGSSI